MASTSKFEFAPGDRVRTVTSVLSGRYVGLGAYGTVQYLDRNSRYLQYGVKMDTGGTAIAYRSNLALVTKADVPRPYKEMTRDELAQKVVEIAGKYKDEHGLCDIVDEALVEMGLGEISQTTKVVCVTVKVSATAGREEIIDAASDLDWYTQADISDYEG